MMILKYKLIFFLCCIYQLNSTRITKPKIFSQHIVPGLRFLTTTLLSSSICFGDHINIVQAKTDLPPLDKCFNALRKEINEGESLLRLENDITTSNWEDIKIFTREYDAGFRGGVLKSIWKQLDGDSKMKGIEISNSFTYDLIGMNKAARNQDPDNAKIMLQKVKQDLTDYLSLEKN